MRLIDADALLESLIKTPRYFDLKFDIDNAPTIDAEPVVRCKDCKHRYDYECPMYREEWYHIDEGDGWYDSDFRVVDETQDDGFCEHGERREP